MRTLDAQRVNASFPCRSRGCKGERLQLDCVLFDSYMKVPVKVAIVLALFGAVLLLLERSFPTLTSGLDFPDFYCAGMMIRHGAARKLYDPVAQQACLVRETGQQGTYYIHPPFEALLFVPLSYMSLKQAYLTWNAISLILLGLAIRSIARSFTFVENAWLGIVALSVLFPPLLLNLLQGQDSVVFLALLFWAYVAFKSGRAGLGGLCLGLCMFKFHLALPIAILLLFPFGRQFAVGFLSTVASLVLLTVAVFGPRIFQVYLQFLRTWQDLPTSGAHWQAMANLRGATALFFSDRTIVAQFVITVSSLVVFLAAIWSWRRAKPARQLQALAFGITVIAGMLVSYHLSPHDLVLLLLPLLALADYAMKSTGSRRWWNIALVFLVLLPPAHLLLLQSKLYGLSWVLVISLFIAMVIAIRLSPNLHLSARTAESQ